MTKLSKDYLDKIRVGIDEGLTEVHFTRDLLAHVDALEAELALLKKVAFQAQEAAKEQLAKADEWRWEYENVCKFSNDYEAQRDGLRAELAEARGWKDVKRTDYPLSYQKLKYSQPFMEEMVKELKEQLSQCEKELHQAKAEWHEETKRAKEAQIELSGARVTIGNYRESNNQLLERFSQTRALLAVRTSALELIMKDVDEGRLSFIGFTGSIHTARASLASTGAEELAAIREIERHLIDLARDFGNPMREQNYNVIAHKALDALKKYFGGGRE